MSDLERFLTKVDTTGECWLWTASIDTSGYGTFVFQGRTFRAHRASYTLLVGEIPDGLHILHSCDVRRCVNPAHLRAGTRSENMQDMVAKGRDNRPGRQKTECLRGHPLSGDNLYVHENRRRCKTCRAEARERSKNAVAKPRNEG